MASANPQKPKPAKPAADDAASNRFVQDGDEGITINGMKIDEYLAHPDTKAALAKSKAAPDAKKGTPKKGDK